MLVSGNRQQRFGSVSVYCSLVPRFGSGKQVSIGVSKIPGYVIRRPRNFWSLRQWLRIGRQWIQRTREQDRTSENPLHERGSEVQARRKDDYMCSHL